MTTIVYRDGILAADTRVMSGGTILPAPYQKIHRLSDGWLFAMCGEIKFEHKMIEALENDAGFPTWTNEGDDESEAVLVDLEGRLWAYEGFGDFVRLRENNPYYATGSGASYAFGALAHGASAEEACRIATQFDTGSGEPVQVLKPGIIEEE